MDSDFFKIKKSIFSPQIKKFNFPCNFFFQLLKRSYLKEDVITLCRTGVLEIYHHLQSHMDKLPKSSKTFTVGHIQALSTMLQILPEKQIALDYVSDIYNASLKILETPQVRTTKTVCCPYFHLMIDFKETSMAN